jgi:hypothetical protein
VSAVACTDKAKQVGKSKFYGNIADQSFNINLLNNKELATDQYLYRTGRLLHGPVQEWLSNSVTYFG